MKYKLTEESKIVDGVTLHRIECVEPFGLNFKAGDKGGWIENESNLSQEGDCWVGGDACVYGNAKVEGDAYVTDNACVYGKARIRGNASIYNNAKVYGNALVFGHSLVRNNAVICGNANVHCYADVRNNAKICGNADVLGSAKVSGDAYVHGRAIINSNTMIYGNAEVSGYAVVSGCASICGDAVVEETSDYVTLKNFWTSNRTFTWTKSNNMWRVGCFYGTGEELIKKAYKDSELSGKCYEEAVRFIERINSIKNEN